MTPDALTTLINATWPAQTMRDVSGWTLRSTKDAGSRANAATATKAAKPEEHPLAAGAQRAIGQTPLFMVRQGEEALDAHLAQAGYTLKDPTVCYTAPITAIATQRAPPVTCFEVWPPLATQLNIWEAGGVNAARAAIMDRAAGPRTTILGRVHNTPAATAFGAVHGRTAMVHAIETLPAFRRQGLARLMIRALAFWAQSHGARTLALLVTQANAPANALYTSLGMTVAARYHYRIHPVPVTTHTAASACCEQTR